ncbi:hypothetical protein NPX13_g8551 [Xylaria arbuscula]|uniref:Uncharacterized protein n=1 Tax=Xylaria arbuscula TaxID=114810 RepID=A0A9W8N8I5_9PEZI|nr:hypothetical protein NPX13_g8551 [Xylaria arbuscula]
MEDHNPIPKRPIPEYWQMGSANFNNRMNHHDGIEALWETKWRDPCSKGLYPFHDGSLEDFKPIFRELIDLKINDGTSEEYTQKFLPTATALEAKGDALMRAADKESREKANELYLRAACVLRIARFPYVFSFARHPKYPEAKLSGVDPTEGGLHEGR